MPLCSENHVLSVLGRPVSAPFLSVSDLRSCRVVLVLFESTLGPLKSPLELPRRYVGGQFVPYLMRDRDPVPSSPSKSVSDPEKSYFRAPLGDAGGPMSEYYGTFAIVAGMVRGEVSWACFTYTMI